MLIRMLRDERGATAIEYGLIVALVALAAVAALQTTGNALDGVFTEATTAMAN